MKAGQGDVTTLSIGDGQRGASVVAGERRAWVADSTGQSWASTISRSRDARTAVSLTAILLPRDARGLILLNAKSARIVEAQLPLVMFAGSHHERIVGSLPPPSNVSVGPYTSCSISTESHESDKSLASSRCSGPTASTRRRSAQHGPTPNPLPREGDLVVHHQHITTITGGHR